jgi:hypothetical protein
MILSDVMADTCFVSWTLSCRLIITYKSMPSTNAKISSSYPSTSKGKPISQMCSRDTEIDVFRNRRL